MPNVMLGTVNIQVRIAYTIRSEKGYWSAQNRWSFRILDQPVPNTDIKVTHCFDVSKKADEELERIREKVREREREREREWDRESESETETETETETV